MGKLTVKGVSNLTTPGIYGDGGGLYLRVAPTGSRRWSLRTKVKGRRVEMGLGSVELVTLAEARAAALHWRGIARRGGDPLAERRKAAGVPTFEAAARQVWKDRIEARGGNGKHAAQWLATLEAYAFPLVGSKPVDEVVSADVLRVLSPIWLTKAETARRVKQRMGVVFDWAIVAGHRATASPLTGIETGLPRQSREVIHHKSMRWQDVPAFMIKLSNRKGMAAAALKLLVLTAARSGEVRGMTWGEVDLDAGVWTVPADRMKARREHRVPLNASTLSVLESVRPLAEAADGSVDDDALVFPGSSVGKMLSDMSMSAVMKRMRIDAVPHGFRTSFRVWAAERSGEAREVLEMCLAHDVGSAVEQAYARSDLFERRRVVMDRWAAWCGGASDCSAEVVSFGRSRV